jgi:NTE family protein
MRHGTPRLGIALSGGTLKAATHVGVLFALEKVGITPDCIAGTSAGSLVGALYAHGYNHDDLQRLITKFPGFHLIDYGFPVATSLMSLAVRKLMPRFVSTVPVVPNGLLRGKKFEQYIHELLANRKPAIPFFIVATDLVSGGPVVFHTQTDFSSRHVSHPITDLPKIITGSCALPGIFTPVPLGEYQLVDGAFRHYVPVTVLREFGCKKIIAVNLYRLPQPFKPTTIVDVLARSFDILLRESIDNDLEHNQDLYVIEPDLAKIKWHSFSDMKKCYRIGQNTVARELPTLNSFLL